MGLPISPEYCLWFSKSSGAPCTLSCPSLAQGGLFLSCWTRQKHLQGKRKVRTWPCSFHCCHLMDGGVRIVSWCSPARPDSTCNEITVWEIHYSFFNMLRKSGNGYPYLFMVFSKRTRFYFTFPGNSLKASLMACMSSNPLRVLERRLWEYSVASFQAHSLTSLNRRVVMRSWFHLLSENKKSSSFFIS